MVLSPRRLPFLLRVLVSPVPRSPRYYEGATTSHPRINSHLLVRSRRPRAPPVFVLASSAPGRAEVSSRPGPLLVPANPSPACSRVGANGISQVFRRSILCLCSVPGPRSNPCILTLTAASVLPPLSGRRRLRRWLISGLTRKLRHLLSYASRGRCRSRAKLASGRLAKPLPGGSRTRWIATRGFSS